jgi:alanyl-tRNA synthetase
VEVSDFDFSACGGTHVRRAGEIGLIKILKLERIRNNIRFEFICGQRTLEDYLWKNRILRELSTRFTVNEGEILSSVEKLSSDLKSQKRKGKKMQEKIAQYEAQEIIQGTKEKIIKELFVDKTPEEVRFLVLNIIRKGDFVVLFGLKGEERGHLILACSENINIDMREIVPLVSPLIKGKGGGRPSLVEIAGEEIVNLEQALERAFEFIKKKMGSDL